MMSPTVPRRRKVGAAALLATCVGVLTLAGSTTALFTETVAVEDNTITSGRLDIDLASADGSTSITATNMVPGDEISKTLTVRNGGTMPLQYVVDVTPAPASGTLAEVLDVSVHDGVQALEDASEGTRVLHQAGFPTPDTEASSTLLSLAPGEEQSILLHAAMQDGAGIEYAAESAELIFTFDAEADLTDDTLVTTWQTGAGSQCADSITLPVFQPQPGGTIDWGDGTTTALTDRPTHTYATPGTHTITVKGAFYGFSTYVQPSTPCLVSVDHWGDDTLATWASYGETTVQEVAQPPVTVTSYGSLFTKSSFNGDISDWDTSHVTNMSSMFSDSKFNGDISNWDTSSLTNMRLMFASSAFSGDISGWDTSKVTNMQQTFYQAKFFDQAIGDWDTANVTSMSGMFDGAAAFNQDISGWDTSSVTNWRDFDRDAMAWRPEFKPVFSS